MRRDDLDPQDGRLGQSARVASLTSMCRHLTAELFTGPSTDEAGDDGVKGAPGRPHASGIPEVQSAAATSATVLAGSHPLARRSEMTIPPPPPHWPVWPSATDHPIAVAPQLAGAAASLDAGAGPDANGPASLPGPDAALAQLAARGDLAALRPRRFGAPAADPDPVDPVDPFDGLAMPPVASVTRASGTAAADPHRRLRRAPRASAPGDLPSLPKFLDPGPLLVTREDRPAGISTSTRAPIPSQGPPALPVGAARRLIPAPPRVRFGTFAGVLMFVAVAGVGVAGAALAPQIASLMPQDNAPQIVVEEVEGVAGAVVPLPVSVETADGTVLSTVVIAGVPEGARLSAGQVNTDGSWVLPPEELPDLAMIPPRGFAGEFFLEVSAVAVDGAERIGQTETMHVVIMPADQTPQIRPGRRI